MSKVTQMLNAIDSGDKQAAAELLPLVYKELRSLAKSRLAGERAGQSLNATDLVHEAYRKLVDNKNGEQEQWNGVSHFFGAAAEAMRRILIDRAREKAAHKRGGDMRRVEFDAIDHPAAKCPEELLDLDVALTQLESQDPQKAKLVKLRFFAGLTMKQAASALGISLATAGREWTYARAWLKTEVKKARE